MLIRRKPARPPGWPHAQSIAHAHTRSLHLIWYTRQSIGAAPIRARPKKGILGQFRLFFQQASSDIEFAAGPAAPVVSQPQSLSACAFCCTALQPCARARVRASACACRCGERDFARLCREPAHACGVHACVHACVRACERACAYVRTHVRACRRLPTRRQVGLRACCGPAYNRAYVGTPGRVAVHDGLHACKCRPCVCMHASVDIPALAFPAHARMQACARYHELAVVSDCGVAGMLVAILEGFSCGE